MRICKNCGIELQPSDVDGYDYVCKFCDENFYDFEAVYEDDGYLTYVSFKCNTDDVPDTPEIIVAIPGILEFGAWSDIRSHWKEFWDKCHDTRDYPDTDEEAVSSVLEELKVPYNIIVPTFTAEY